MNDAKYIQDNIYIDCHNRQIVDFAHHLIDPTCRIHSDMAVKLYYAVRDQITYDPYAVTNRPDDYRASHILARGRGFCIQKAILLCALARAVGIPSRLGFATVGNHLASSKLIEFTGGSHVFVFHGFTELWLHERWIKATPAFNAELCTIYEVPPLEFNGQEDALFQAYNSAQKPFMDYLQYLGTYATFPLPEMLKAWEDFYGAERVHCWFESGQSLASAKHKAFELEKPFTPA